MAVEPLRLRLRVLLDTTELWHRYNVDIPALKAVQKAGLEVGVPSVVVDEVANQYREELEEGLAGLKTATRLLGLLGETAPLTPIDTATKTATFRRFFVERLESMGATVLPYPEIQHEAVVARDLRRRKPFDRTGKGYRDALIWETLLEWARLDLDTPIAFVTNNKTDFGGTDLDETLRRDLKGRGLPDAFVEKIKSLTVLVDHHLKPTLQALAGMAAQLEAGTFENLNLKKWLETTAEKAFGGRAISPRTLRLHGGGSVDYIGAKLSSVVSVEEIVSCDVRRLADKSIYVSATVSVLADFLVESVIEPDEPDFEDQFEEPELVQEVETARVDLSFSLIVNEATWQVDLAALDDVRFTQVLNPHD